MTITEHILTEECAEVSQRSCKAIRFGLEEVQAGQELTNAERLVEEFSQLYGVMEILYSEGKIQMVFSQVIANQKKEAFEKWLKLSRAQGTLNRLTHAGHK